MIVSVRTLPAGSTARRKARRFWGTMGATMMHTSRWLDGRDHARSDAATHRADVEFAASNIRAIRGF